MNAMCTSLHRVKLVWLGSLDHSGGVCLDSNKILYDNFFVCN